MIDSSMNNFFKLFLLIILFITAVWCTGAVFYTVNWHGWQQIFGTALFVSTVLILLISAAKISMIYAFDLLVIESLVIGHFILLTPAEQFSRTVWQQPWARCPDVKFNGNFAEISDVRDFVYRSESDYDVHYKTVTINMDQVRYLDLAVSHWDGLEKVAHTMLSFEFADGTFLAFSMETRLPEGAKQGFIPGIYKQYELLPIVATEEDVFKLRTNFRKEELYLYRTNADHTQTRQVLETLLRTIAVRHTQPVFYNSITRNCTTSLAPLLRMIEPGFTRDIRLLLNGRADELLFEMGYLACRDGETFAELKQRRKANLYVGQMANYSRAIRQDL